MPLSEFQQFCADTGCPDNVHTLALWTQRNDAVAEQERLKQSLYAAHESITYWMKSSDVLLAEVTKLKAEREQIEKQEHCIWQPIDIAPKDNKRPLLLASFNDDGTMQDFDTNGSWEWEQESWEMPQQYCYWASDYGRVEEPTHWMYQPEWLANLNAHPPVPDGKVLVPLAGVVGVVTSAHHLYDDLYQPIVEVKFQAGHDSPDMWKQRDTFQQVIEEAMLKAAQQGE